MMNESRPMPQAPVTYEDSVQAITGKPTWGGHYTPQIVPQLMAMRGDVDGSYNSALGGYAAIAKNPGDPQRQDWVFAHEMGHHYDAASKDRGLRAVFDSAKAVNPEPGGYAATSPGEHFAEAFAQAISTLRGTASDDMRGMSAGVAKDWVQTSDINVPGSVAILKKLLESNPMYANHPLQAYMNMVGQQQVTPKVAVQEYSGRIPRY